MLRVLINRSKVLRITEKVPTHIEIAFLHITNKGGQKKATLETCNKIAAWVYDLVQRTEGSIYYNGRLIDKAKVKPYKG